jgi:hypothetical protein
MSDFVKKQLEMTKDGLRSLGLTDAQIEDSACWVVDSVGLPIVDDYLTWVGLGTLRRYLLKHAGR